MKKFEWEVLFGFLSIWILSIIIGTGMAFLEGLVAFSGHGMETMLKGATIAALPFGALLGALFGLIIFNLFDKRNIDYIDFSKMICSIFFIGAGSAALLNLMADGGGVLTLYITPIVTLVAIFVLRSRRPKACNVIPDKSKTEKQ